MLDTRLIVDLDPHIVLPTLARIEPLRGQRMRVAVHQRISEIDVIQPVVLHGSVSQICHLILNADERLSQGYDDWRVPNIHELETIRDFDAQAQRLAGNSVFILQARRIAYFSSTTIPSQPGRVFGLNAGSRVEYQKNDPTLHVRPVRTVIP